MGRLPLAGGSFVWQVSSSLETNFGAVSTLALSTRCLSPVCRGFVSIDEAVLSATRSSDDGIIGCGYILA